MSFFTWKTSEFQQQRLSDRLYLTGPADGSLSGRPLEESRGSFRNAAVGTRKKEHRTSFITINPLYSALVSPIIQQFGTAGWQRHRPLVQMIQWNCLEVQEAACLCFCWAAKMSDWGVATSLSGMTGFPRTFFRCLLPVSNTETLQENKDVMTECLCHSSSAL